MLSILSYSILDILPKDILGTLFIILPITAKRNFTRCNRELNLKKDEMEIYENEFMAGIKKFYKFHLPSDITKLEQYTLEMVYDNCAHLIPSAYICKQNVLCDKYPFLYFYCATLNNVSLIKKLIKFNPKHNIYITCGAAYGGHLDVLKWTRENGCEWDWRTCSNAAENGHLHVLKWARENGCPEN